MFPQNSKISVMPKVGNSIQNVKDLGDKVSLEAYDFLEITNKQGFKVEVCHRSYFVMDKELYINLINSGDMESYLYTYERIIGIDLKSKISFNLHITYMRHPISLPCNAVSLKRETSYVTSVFSRFVHRDTAFMSCLN